MAVLTACSNGLRRSSTAQRTTRNAAGSKRTSIVSLTPRIPAGTNVTVRLLEAITSRSAKLGEQFGAELTSHVMIAGKLAFPKGTRLRGHVAAVRRSVAKEGPGYLRLTLDAIQMLDGRWIDIDTTSISARGDRTRGNAPEFPEASGTSFGSPSQEDVEAVISTNRRLQFAVREDAVMLND